MKISSIRNLSQVGVYEFPKFKNEKERIKYNSKKYKNTSIAEAFCKEYGIKTNINDNMLAMERMSCRTFNINDVITAQILSIDKDGAKINVPGMKENIRLKQNITSQTSTKPGDLIKVALVDKVGDTFIGDCVIPIVDKFIKSASLTMDNKFQSTEVYVQNLKVIRGGFTGDINIPEVTHLLGKTYKVNAFIPGSAIALNIERDFKQWEGKGCYAMVMNFTVKNDLVSFICSRKKLLNASGCKSLINLYDTIYSQDSKFEGIFEGVVTGIINSAKKQGVFIEVPEYNFTGLLPKESRDLVNYRIGDEISVNISDITFDKKNEDSEPYHRNREGVITACYLKPIFEEVKL